MPEAVVIIPARYASTRFPGKPLAILGGRPIILRVLEGAQRAKLVSDVIVATDDQRIRSVVEAAGGRVVMTSGGHETGTDRVAEIAGTLACDIIVNVQGDEPFIQGTVIDDIVRVLQKENSSVGMATLAVRIDSAKEILNPNVVKVVWDESGLALYFSRSPIPFYRDVWATSANWADLINLDLSETEKSFCFKHIGIYGYRRRALLRLSRARPSALERIEKLEQLRALSMGIKIKVLETSYDSFGIDTPEDLSRAEQWLNSSS